MLSSHRRTALLLTGLALISGAAITLIETLTLQPGLWASYAFLILFGEVLIYIAWRLVEGEGAAKGLFTLALLGLTLRVGVGVALYQGMPRWGYSEKAQRAGYVYWDAYKRDRDAYALAKSDQPLSTAYSSSLISDQYGGLLAFSALIYRYAPVPGHHPLLVVIPLAAISSLAIFFTWGVAKRGFGSGIAEISAWVVALYPEAVLLGASQMREPFLMTGLSLALFGYTYLRGGEKKPGLLYLAISILLLGLPISPPFIAVVLATVLFMWLWQIRSVSRWQIIGFAFAVLVAAAAIVLAARTWATFEGIGGSTGDIILGWLENATSQWRFNLVSDQSALVDSVLDRLPGALQLPFLVLYGVIQPFLPASLVAPGAAVWKVIGIWRSLGWAFILPLLAYASLRAPGKAGWRSIMTYFVFYVWVTALLASYRAPSYQWDSPRYRAVFVSIQAVVAAWAWYMAKTEKDPWLGRIFIIFGIVFGMFTLWYIGRYLGGVILSVNATILIATGFSSLYLAAMTIKDRRASVGKVHRE